MVPREEIRRPKKYQDLPPSCFEVWLNISAENQVLLQFDDVVGA